MSSETKIDDGIPQFAKPLGLDVIAERKAFEEWAFAEYFVNGIRRNPDTKPRISGALDFVPTNTLTKAKFTHRDDDGRYTHEGVEPAWLGWWARAVDESKSRKGV